MSAEALELVGVGKDFRRRGTLVRALEGIDLRIDRRSFVCSWSPSSRSP